MAADGGRGDVRPQDGGDRRSPEEQLAHALLLEAVDCISQARDLLAGDEARAALSGCADALVEIVRRLPPARCVPPIDA
jgi:hypothetical protein